MSAARFDRLDALRGAAIVWMAAFHLCFDLNHLGLWSPRQNFYEDPLWTLQRSAILSLFLFCAGLSQAVALQQMQPWRSFWRRWAQIVGCALLVSLGSALMFPRSWISFGVLHGIALMLLLSRLLSHLLARVPAPAQVWLWALGGLCLVLPQAWSHPFFDSRWTNWLGLVTRKPVTEDFVPLLPWLGVLLWGLAAGRWLLQRHPGLLQAPLPRLLRPLSALGRWSLSVYMVHQPLFIGSLMLWIGLR